MSPILLVRQEGFPEMKRELQGMLARAGQTGRPAMLDDAGRQTVKIVEKRFARGGPGWAGVARGGKPLWDEGLLAASNDYRVTGNDLAVGNTRPQANVQNKGKEIRAKAGGWLTIPLLAFLTKTESKMRARFFENTFFKKSKAGNLILFQVIERARSREIRPLFVLKKRVKLTERPFLFWDYPTLRLIADRWSRFLKTGRFA